MKLLERFRLAARSDSSRRGENAIKPLANIPRKSGLRGYEVDAAGISAEDLTSLIASLTREFFAKVDILLFKNAVVPHNPKTEVGFLFRANNTQLFHDDRPFEQPYSADVSVFHSHAVARDPHIKTAVGLNSDLKKTYLRFIKSLERNESTPPDLLNFGLELSTDQRVLLMDTFAREVAYLHTYDPHSLLVLNNKTCRHARFIQVDGHCVDELPETIPFRMGLLENITVSVGSFDVEGKSERLYLHQYVEEPSRGRGLIMTV